MKLEIESVSLVGSTRKVAFEPGLNIVSGPITTGKTKLLEMCGALLGLKVDKPTPELGAVVSAIAGQLIIGADTFTVVRPLVTTANAPVDIAGKDFAARIPAIQPDRQGASYGVWLLSALDLPRISVPRAPTQADSDPTPVSISDYLSYCILDQEEIDSSVCGHKDPFRNIKRRYVFEILYGLYDVQTAQLHERIRALSAEIRFLQNDETTLDRILSDTEWASRLDLSMRHAQAQRELDAIRAEVVAHAGAAPRPPRVEQLRRSIFAIDRAMADTQEKIAHEQTSVTRLRELVGQLVAQSARLTRAIVAEDLLVDFEFRSCPRCGSVVSQERGSDVLCVLCLQPPASSASKRDLIGERSRVENQVSETEQLIVTREVQLKELAGQVVELEARRRQSGMELDRELESFVSDTAGAIRDVAAREATQKEVVIRLADYLRLFEKLDAARERLGRLQGERRMLEEQLDARSSARASAQQRLDQLDEAFRANLQRMHVPEIGEVGFSYIDKNNYLPIVNGRSFDNLSSLGLKVLVNIAHTLAHQEVAPRDSSVSLPGIVLIDGPTSNIGHEGTDRERAESIYRYLIEIGERLGGRVQLIVADNDVPAFAERYVRIRFSEEDRLVPQADLRSVGFGTKD